ncbi:hypothetical protein EBB54_15825 [Schaedlerella arabinosiphila]|uniref:Uncharacterized protein n=1 Tax=Schaedlerella arabinosiphila TaxID=2044587 RepID=A0A3R8LG76_9FIRM|nr:hypothetical protein EBB54_15825 [Schaedlerella arabinosiphila]
MVSPSSINSKCLKRDYTISILLFQFLVALQAQGVRSMVHGPGVYSKDFYFLSCRQEKTC